MSTAALPHAASPGRGLARMLRAGGLALAAAFGLTACELPIPGAGGAAGPAVTPGAPVTVALLVPGQAAGGPDAAVSRDLENAARLALADVGAGRIDLRVYPTGGQAAGAAAAAERAIAEGAGVILGPLYAEAANAAGVAARPAGINVLSFSNNSAIAGGNVFVLGPTFENTARRLVSYAARQGRGQIVTVHAETPAGQAGAAAIQEAARASGARVVGTVAHEFSQAGVAGAVPAIAGQVRSSGASAVMFTSDTAGALPLLVQLLPEQGVRPPAQQYIGLTRWDIPAATVALPGVQGAWFALPDPNADAAFDARYAAAYGARPHPLAGLAYDGVAAIAQLAASGRRDALSGGQIARRQGFSGTTGAFRLRPDGTNDRALAVAQIQDGRVVVIDPAPRALGGAGS